MEHHDRSENLRSGVREFLRYPLDCSETPGPHIPALYPQDTRERIAKGWSRLEEGGRGSEGGAVAEVLRSLVRSQIWYPSSQILKSHYEGSELEVPISKHPGSYFQPRIFDAF